MKAVLLALLLALPAAATEFYVAPDGDDANPGTKSKPFATIPAARDAVRKRVKAGLTEDVRVVIASGTYYLPEGLVLGPMDSGTAEHAITYVGRGEPAPRLIGGVPLDGVRKDKDAVFVADLPKGAAPKVVTENGVRLVLAREPNEGWARVRRPGRRGDFIYYGDLFKGVSGDLSEGFASIWPSWGWHNHHLPLKSVDPAAHRVVLAAKADLRKRNRFRLVNLPGVMDLPGECVVRAKASKLYLRPRKAPPGTIVIATADRVVTLRGGEPDGSGSVARPVRNVHFENLDFSTSNKDAIYMAGVAQCSIRACRVENAWDRGIFVRGAATRVTLVDSEVRHVGDHGIELKGAPFGGPDINKHHTIRNCHVHFCGLTTGHAGGIRIDNSGHNVVEHCHIHHTPRQATSIKGLTAPFIKNREQRKNRYKLLHSRNNRIAWNHIHHVDLDTEDTGAMQSWGPGRDNVYDHNLIHDVGNPHSQLHSGLYLDDATDHFTVTNNVIYNVIGRNHTQVIYAKGVGNVIENNVLIVGKHCWSAIRTKQSVECHSHVYRRNIIAFENPGAAIYHHDGWTRGRIKACDHNVYWSTGGLRLMGNAPTGASYAGWRKRFDQSSLTIDPEFVDPTKRDYRLKPTSPARKLGIQSVDIRAAGLTETFPQRLDRE
jgi:hypothetical protein